MMKEEARAVENKKREGARADQVVHAAEIKADKIMANAKDEAVRIKARANEEAEKTIADSKTQSERERGGIEESKKVEIGQLGDKVEQMKNAGEFPVVAKKGVMGRVKDKVTGH
jgi:vacuolar-type H+-ATPase subunit H